MVEILKTCVSVAGWGVLYLVMFAGVVLIPLGLPGQFVIVCAALACTLVVGSAVLPWWVFFVLLGLAVLAEAVEALFGLLTATRRQGSCRNALGGVAGGIAGAVAGSFVAPIIGSLVGAFAGTFLGASAVEMYRTRRIECAADVGRSAVLARVFGSICKVAIALGMMALVTAVLVLRG